MATRVWRMMIPSGRDGARRSARVSMPGSLVGGPAPPAARPRRRPLSTPGDRVGCQSMGLLEGRPEPAKEVARAHTGRGWEPGGAGAEDGPALSGGDDHHHAAAAARRQPRAARLPAHPGLRAGTGDPLRVPLRAVLP